LSKDEFDLMGKHPPLISNISRGPIIDQPALVEALKDGRVAAATLDVTDPEPLPSNDPLWTAPNVYITPHISGGSINYTTRAFDILEGNIVRLEKGEELMNRISRRKGY
jgi:phosphoglycerate dehydrogenase-like enzyme